MATWYSDNGRRLTSERSWVRILTYTVYMSLFGTQYVTSDLDHELTVKTNGFENYVTE